MLLHTLLYRFTSHFLYSTVLMWSQALISQTSFHNKQMFIPLFYLYSAFVHMFILFFLYCSHMHISAFVHIFILFLITVHICTYTFISFILNLISQQTNVHSTFSVLNFCSHSHSFSHDCSHKHTCIHSFHTFLSHFNLTFWFSHQLFFISSSFVIQWETFCGMLTK